ncbi:hypothetical protein ACN47E_002485 [Coniothyrium glycines]
MQVSGNSYYLLNIPDNYYPNKTYRDAFEWYRGDSAQKIVDGEKSDHGGVRPYYGLEPIDNNSAAIFLVPDGLNAGWVNHNGEEVTIFEQLVKTIEFDLRINANLHFSTDFSNGGAMSYSLVCARTDMIRPVAIIYGAELSGCSGRTQPVAYCSQHGTNDSVLDVAMCCYTRDKFVASNDYTKLASEPQPNGGISVQAVYSGCTQRFLSTWHSSTMGSHIQLQADYPPKLVISSKAVWQVPEIFSCLDHPL